jgi:signal transduction histidine kinase
VQEVLHNAARHAQATIVRVLVHQEPGRLMVVVQDNGKGFDPKSTRGLGLLGMEERVRRLGGVFHVESEPGRGALIKVQLPVADLHTDGEPPQ